MMIVHKSVEVNEYLVKAKGCLLHEAQHDKTASSVRKRLN